MNRSHIVKNKIAIVCSARSAATKTEGTTNRYILIDHKARANGVA